LITRHSTQKRALTHEFTCIPCGGRHLDHWNEGIYGAYRVNLQSRTAQKTNYLIEHGSSQTLNLLLAFKGEAFDKNLGKRGSVFAVELLVGEYEVSSWQIAVPQFATVPLEAAIADRLVIERVGGSSQSNSEFPIFIPIRR
jgi:hypothetical protein